ncbi:hypothetical protein [Streptomyces sp. NPDC097619]|uniref:hypothetical protein n=1 Tax=Streptomyces sp. NPDC097619 TaxID=3157228 RepID=UPI003329ABA6
MDRNTPAGEKATSEPEKGPAQEKRIDLSVAQVAGSSLATVAAAVLASQLGVYGTILGAGVVSVVATAGGPVIQHFFRRTGEQLREAGESARPKARQVPLRQGDATHLSTPTDRTAILPLLSEEERTRLLRAPGARSAHEPEPHDRTMMLRAPAHAPSEALRPDPGHADATRPMPLGADRPEDPRGRGEFGAASVHGTRMRGWKRTALAAAVVFGVSLGGITAYEALSGTNLSGGHTPTVRAALTGGGSGTGTKDKGPSQEEKDKEKEKGKERGEDGKGADSGTRGPSPSPDRSGPSADPDPSGTPAPPPDPTPPPTPSPTPPDPKPSPDASSADPDSGRSPAPAPNPGGSTGTDGRGGPQDQRTAP